MFKHIRIVVILLALAAILFKFATGIAAMNRIKDEGETLLLQLRPVDPHALMLGDYMALAYADVAFLDTDTDTDTDLPPQGTLLLKLDQQKVGTFSRVDNGTKPGIDEIRVKYVLKRNRADFGSARYYFQEGTAKAYEKAEYGVFKVSPTGHMILMALADENFKVLTSEPVSAAIP